MIKAIIFDFDGTLTNGELFDYNALSDFLRPYFPDKEGMEYEAIVQNFLDSYIFATGPQDFRHREFSKIQRYGLRADLGDELEKFWEAEVYKYTELRDNAMEVLTRLKKKYKIGILTNGGTERQHNKVKKAGIYDMIDAMAVSQEVGSVKPERPMYEVICERLGVKFEECIMIGDNFSGDVLGAYRVGMPSIWFMQDTDRPGGLDIPRVKDLSELEAVIEKIDAQSL